MLCECVWCVDVCTPKCLHMFHRALRLSVAICPIWPKACPARATDLARSHPSSMLATVGKGGGALRVPEADRGNQRELPCSLSCLWLGAVCSGLVHSERLAIFTDLFPDCRALPRPLEGWSFSRFSTILERRMRWGEDSYLLRAHFVPGTVLYIILFKPHRALPGG